MWVEIPSAQQGLRRASRIRAAYMDLVPTDFSATSNAVTWHRLCSMASSSGWLFHDFLTQTTGTGDESMCKHKVGGKHKHHKPNTNPFTPQKPSIFDEDP